MDSPLNYVIILVTSATLSSPSLIPNPWTSLPPFIQCGQELIFKTFWSHSVIDIFTRLKYFQFSNTHFWNSSFSRMNTINYIHFFHKIEDIVKFRSKIQNFCHHSFRAKYMTKWSFDFASLTHKGKRWSHKKAKMIIASFRNSLKDPCSIIFVFLNTIKSDSKIKNHGFLIIGHDVFLTCMVLSNSVKKSQLTFEEFRDI